MAAAPLDAGERTLQLADVIPERTNAESGIVNLDDILSS
jgi:hypothetical protein